MNILFLSTEIPFPADGGHHLRTLNVLKILAKDHNIFLVAFAQDAAEFRHIPEMEKYCRMVKVFPVAKTGKNPAFLFQIVRNLFSRLPLVARRYYLPTAAHFVQEAVKTQNIDLVHIDMLALGSYRHLFGATPVLLTDHNVEFIRLYRWSQVEKNPLVKLFLRYQYLKLKKFEIETCRDVDHCTVVSHTDLITLGELCQNGHYSVIPNGVDTDFFQPVSASMQANRLIWVGGMGGPYNADAVDYFLASIWPLIRRQRPQVRVDFIGSSPTALLRKTADLDPNVRALGFVDDIRTQVQEATVFIAPIRSGSGTKIKVLNAMAQAKAVVATSIALEGIEAADGEAVYTADDPATFARRVLELLEQPDLAERIGRNARILIETKYSWTVIDRDIKQLYAMIHSRIRNKRKQQPTTFTEKEMLFNTI
jgi:glycosyltransferase involved in cell wall biosynthesis